MYCQPLHVKSGLLSQAELRNKRDFSIALCLPQRKYEKKNSSFNYSMAKLNKNGVKTEESVAEHIHSCG